MNTVRVVLKPDEMGVRRADEADDGPIINNLRNPVHVIPRVLWLRYTNANNDARDAYRAIERYIERPPEQT